MGGVNMISQAPILPDEYFTYTCKAEPTGTHWYHSHTGVQYSDGLFGPLIIEEHNNPYQEAYDSERIVIMNDWFHAPSNQILSNMKSGKYMGKKKRL